MWVRIRGLFIMIRILTPVLAIAAVWLVTHQAVSAVDDATFRYRTAVDARVDNIRDDVSAATDALSAVGGFAIGVRDAVGRQVTAIRDIGNLTVPLPTVPFVNFDIPDIDVAIPGSAELKRLASGIDSAGEALGDNLGAITDIAKVPGEVRAIADETNGLMVEVKDTIVGWARVIGVILIAVIVVFVVGRISRLVTEFRRGWLMFRTGVDQRTDTLSALLRRVAVLEARLAIE